jgi:hypothetical protein
MSRMESGRWGGMALILAGIFFLPGFPGLSEIVPGLSHAGGHVLIAVGAALATLGVAGLRARYADAVSGAGRTGLLMGIVGGTMLFVGNAIEGMFGEQTGWAIFMIGAVLLLAGTIAFGRAALRAGALPSWGVWPLTAGAAGSLALVAIMVGIIVVGAIVRGQRNEGGGTPPAVLTVAIALLISPGWAMLGAAAFADSSRHAARQAAPRA